MHLSILHQKKKKPQLVINNNTASRWLINQLTSGIFSMNYPTQLNHGVYKGPGFSQRKGAGRHEGGAPGGMYRQRQYCVTESLTQGTEVLPVSPSNSVAVDWEEKPASVFSLFLVHIPDNGRQRTLKETLNTHTHTLTSANTRRALCDHTHQ